MPRWLPASARRGGAAAAARGGGGRGGREGLAEQGEAAGVAAARYKSSAKTAAMYEKYSVGR